MTIDADFLLSRLPAFYRERDRELGGPLQALLGILAEQGAIVEADIAQLYDNWFIETCDAWVIPYIGDLLGVRGLYALTGTGAVGQRAYVANSLRLRRRKGTVTVLEQLALDTTGWRSRAVEFFQLLGVTQHVNHVRLANVRTPDLRDAARLERTDGAFDRSAHSAEVRGLPAGRYNIPNVGLFLWRLQSYALQRTAAQAVTTLPGFYTFDALGRSASAAPGQLGMLFNRPRTETEVSHVAEPRNVPEPLSRRVLHDELSALRQALTDGESPNLVYFDASDAEGPVLRIWLDGVEVPPEHLLVCNLSPLPAATPEAWRRPPSSSVVEPTKPGLPSRTFPADPAQCLVGFDPVLGRIALPLGKNVSLVEVSYAYGFPGDVGGGPYDRRPARLDQEADLGLFNRSDFDQVRTVPGDHPTLAAALNAVSPGSRTLIRLLSDSTEQVIPALNLPDTELAIEADNRRRPAILGDLVLRGNVNTRLRLSGLLIDGALRLSGPLRRVELRHCSLTPSRGGIAHTGNASELSIRLTHTLCGALSVEHTIGDVSALYAVLDNSAGLALALAGTPLTLECCTVFGGTQAGELSASNCLFGAALSIARSQQGCVRFSYVPPGSQTPRRHRCQPDLVSTGVTEIVAKSERTRVTPAFTSVAFGSAAYAQLSLTTASEIRTGADDGAEMGVWNLLQQPQREANLRQALDEYLRFGLEACAIFVN